MSDDTSSLAAAIRWAQSAWSTLPQPPLRLHDRDIEELSQLGSHRFSSPMWRILNSTPWDEEVIDETVTCFHPRLFVRDDPKACPDCRGDNVTTVTRRRYVSPMAAALARLAKVPRPSDGTPSSLILVLALSECDWSVWKAGRLLGLEPVSEDHYKTQEAMFLLALRRLHSRYSSGPVPKVGWVSKSESQQRAEDAA